LGMFWNVYFSANHPLLQVLFVDLFGWFHTLLWLVFRSAVSYSFIVLSWVDASKNLFSFFLAWFAFLSVAHSRAGCCFCFLYPVPAWVKLTIWFMQPWLVVQKGCLLRSFLTESLFIVVDMGSKIKEKTIETWTLRGLSRSSFGPT
jgi:hypothetical protein